MHPQFERRLMQGRNDLPEDHWDLVIRPQGKGTTFNWRELLRYRDLLFLFVKRDFISLYKQTVLGPIWVVIQPVLTTITFFIVFTKIASIGTAGIPPILFYMLGITVWTYFADCVVKTSDTFIVNQNLFGKVYFPRLVLPLSIVITNLIKFGIQTILFLLVYTFFYFFDPMDLGVNYGPNIHILLFPVLVLIMAAMGLGFGLIISALTTKYRDLRFLIQFGIQLVMYATPVVWPLATIDKDLQWKLFLNPMASVVETFKVGFFGTGPANEPFAVMNWYFLGYSFVFAMIVLIIGIRLFSRIEKSFMDTI